ncbi:MAG TPA: AMP-binding protein [Jatrophihabitans sp.]|jgi:long-chain acyl-CoA synthetase|uniref:class I adenylate-forming enzyme family protein n=1 Tax=Jatrophihabitans sp. TaxID=1932789 RepID=UPI002E0AD3EE|nr:AMP-binding protein [Jatrophihabitans sp.]
MLSDPRGSSLAVLAEQSEKRFGAESSLVFEGTTTTSAELGALGRRFAAGLSSIGVRAGDRVAVCMANCPEVLATYHAVWRLGAAVTPLLFLLSEDELQHALSDSGAAAIVTTPEFLPKVLAAASGLDVRVVVTGAGTGGASSFDELASGEEAPLVDADPTSMAALLYTGGTTGRSKGVMLSHDALSSAAHAAVLASEDDDYGVSLLPLPLAHAYGLLVATMSLHAVRPNRTVLMRWFDPVGWLTLAQDERVQTGATVPTMLRLLAAQPLEDYDLSALRRLVSGSAPLPAEVRDEWLRRLPSVEVVEGYGCSEIAALASTTPTGQARAGSVGRAAPGVQLRIELPDGGDAGPDEDGEICILTPGLMTGYWNDAETTALAVRDGWFHTGDVGHLDSDGYLYVVDRMKDIIIRGGFNVYPRDVEEALIRHPDVAVCAVIGRPDEKQGEEIVAFVQLVPGAAATPDDLVAFGREHLSAVKYPREVHVVDTLPLTSIGKLDRKALRSRV